MHARLDHLHGAGGIDRKPCFVKVVLHKSTKFSIMLGKVTISAAQIVICRHSECLLSVEITILKRAGFFTNPVLFAVCNAIECFLFFLFFSTERHSLKHDYISFECTACLKIMPERKIDTFFVVSRIILHIVSCPSEPRYI